MNDKELLELAAKAAGIDGEWIRDTSVIQERWYFNVPYDNQGMLTGFEWSPLKDDCDALRLAVRLRLPIEFPSDKPYGPDRVFINNGYGVVVNISDDPYAATRRAIVRAAAEIGRSMK